MFGCPCIRARVRMSTSFPDIPPRHASCSFCRSQLLCYAVYLLLSSLSACLPARPMSPSERDCLSDCVTLRRDLSSSRARCLRRSYVLAMTLTWSVVGRRFARSAALGTERVAECRGTCHMVSRTWRRGAEKRTARDQIAPGGKFSCWCPHGNLPSGLFAMLIVFDWGLDIGHAIGLSRTAAD